MGFKEITNPKTTKTPVLTVKYESEDGIYEVKLPDVEKDEIEHHLNAFVDAFSHL